MGVVYNSNNYGLFKNGDFRDGNFNFSWGEANTVNKLSGSACLQIVGGGGATALSDQFLEVDTTKSYQMIAYARTISRGTAGTLAGGHLGFSCYDQFFNFIDLRNCGDIGNTTLSRTANPGDSIIYFTSSTGWFTGADVTNNYAFSRQILFFPSTHPYYSTPWQYTRFNNVSYYRMEQTPQGDWAVYLDANISSQINTYTATTLPNYGYSLPAGTPISRGAAGGTFNYALGAPDYPETWTRFATPVFTGSSYNSGYPFRYGTKYIKFMVLRNYNRRLEAVQDHVWAIDRVFFGQVLPGRDYSSV